VSKTASADPRAKQRAYNRAYAARRRADPVARRVLREKWVSNRYGLSAQEYWAAEAAGCALCGEPFVGKTPHVDHCHKTGHVRGLLCASCNKGLGHFKDDIETLERAVAYLRRTNPDTTPGS
jgi:hypothetical protein